MSLHRKRLEQIDREQRARVHRQIRQSQLIGLEHEERRLRREIARQHKNELALLRRSHDEVAALAKELEASNAALSRTNARLTALARAISHDLRAPARQIGSLLEMVQRHVDVSGQGKTCMDAALDARSRLLAMLDDLTAAMKGIDPQLETFDVRDALEVALDNLRDRIDATSATLEIAALPVAEGSPLEMTQLFQNLVGNALIYRRTEPLRIRIGSRATPSGVVYSIEDNGQGMDPKHAERIFMPFQRISSDGDGTGMGLFICRSIVENRGGRIWVEPNAGPGCTFSFELPGPAEFSGAVAGSAIRVLVVDDDEADRLLTRCAVEDAMQGEVEVEVVDSGEAALQRLRCDDVDCVLVDFTLKTMDGLELLAGVNELATQVRVIAVSGSSDRAWSRDMLAAGAEAAIRKDHLFDLAKPQIASIIRRSARERRSESSADNGSSRARLPD